MRQEKFLEIFDSLPTKRKQVLLGILRGDIREKIMSDLGIPSESALAQHKKQLYKDFQIEVLQNEADDPRTGERKSPQLIALCAKYKPDLVSPNAALTSSVIPTPLPIPDFLTYDPETFTGREELIRELLEKLRGQTRLVWITGMSGIGKTTLGGCVASQAWESDPSFQWVYLEIEEERPEFVSTAVRLLEKLGDRLDPQEQNDPTRLIARLLHKLQANNYWIQIDSLERLFNPEQDRETAFIDGHWVNFLKGCLTAPSLPSRLVLTAQALPTGLAEFSDFYPNFWQAITLQGLVADDQHNEHLELFAKNFAKNRVIVNEASTATLGRIGAIYEGHPLVIQVIAGEIGSHPFRGDVMAYWQSYSNEFEQDARELQTEQVNLGLRNQQLQKRVRRRVETSLKRLPLDALDILCRSSVYRRPVPKTFWLEMIKDRTPQQQQQAYGILNDRALVEQELYEGKLLIRQHNLIRSVAYDLLKVDANAWETFGRRAARLWLQEYRPAPDAPNLEKVRGYLEAFYHYCEIGYWNNAISKAYTEELETGERLYWQLQLWSYYREVILLCNKLIEIFWKLGEYGRAGNALGSLGTAYNSLGQDEQAIYFHQQHLTIARDIGDRNGESVALGNLGTAYNSLGQHEKAIELYQEHLTIARQMNDLEGEGSALVNLGSVYVKMERYDLAIKFFEQSLAISEQINDVHTKAIVMGNLGVAYIELGDHQRAINYHQQNILIARDMGYRESEASALGNLGGAYLEMEQYDQAINFFEQSYNLACEIDAYGIKRKSLKGLGTAYYALGNKHLSLGIAQELQVSKLYQKSLTIARELSDRNMESKALLGLAGMYYSMDKYPEAINLYKECLKILQELGDRVHEGRALGNLGNIYRNQEQYEKAIKFYQQSLSIKREIGDRQGMPMTLKNLAKLYQISGELDLARDYCQQALALATELGIPLAAECEALLLKIDSKIEDSSTHHEVNLE